MTSDFNFEKVKLTLLYWILNTCNVVCAKPGHRNRRFQSASIARPACFSRFSSIGPITLLRAFLNRWLESVAGE